MRIRSGWSPWLADGPGAAAERLVSALSRDIVDGVVDEGERLPAHRVLAADLGIAVGTVTKAYTELARRGLVRGAHGRGMFVGPRPERAGGDIDLDMNAPPPMLADQVIADALAAGARRVDATTLAAVGPPGGRLEHRRPVARWLATSGLEIDAERLLLTQGAQQAIVAAMLVAWPSGGSGELLTEEVTFPGALAYARMVGCGIRGVPIDHQGMRPDLLDAALTASARSGRRPLVYVTPTTHNPTGVTMRAARRRELVRVARRHDALLLEDDVYALSEERSAPTLLALAPERTCYVTSASKALSPAVRVGALVVPPSLRTRAERAVRVLGLPVSPLICVVLDELVAAGVAETVRSAIRDEGARRLERARTAFGRNLFGAPTAGYHVYLPLPGPTARAVVDEARSRGVLLTRPESMLADPEQVHSGIRICLGGPSMDELERGLGVLRSLIPTRRAQARVVEPRRSVVSGQPTTDKPGSPR
ncbi:PLP-dependent aminotransferase family protein [Gordonia soli]|uniref:Putative GntR family transcriptional regulator n=1 Tax=Gordonia soli NBRC 108243 TaxID=1223545 RepID=M0QDJ5_9ACTN|nr:PLP-dependent aminotransferase family protein [Gordonia soli]GAC66376.1 putative GntR family transcriptional regulator [Gordonia soli NBRC 108243]